MTKQSAPETTNAFKDETLQEYQKAIDMEGLRLTCWAPSGYPVTVPFKTTFQLQAVIKALVSHSDWFFSANNTGLLYPGEMRPVGRDGIIHWLLGIGLNEFAKRLRVRSGIVERECCTALEARAYLRSWPNLKYLQCSDFPPSSKSHDLIGEMIDRRLAILRYAGRKAEGAWNQLSYRGVTRGDLAKHIQSKIKEARAYARVVENASRVPGLLD